MFVNRSKPVAARGDRAISSITESHSLDAGGLGDAQGLILVAQAPQGRRVNGQGQFAGQVPAG